MNSNQGNILSKRKPTDRLAFRLMRKYGLNSESRNKEVEAALFEAERRNADLVDNQQKMIDLFASGLTEVKKSLEIMNMQLKRTRGW